MQRRTLLTSLSAVGTVAITGCSNIRSEPPSDVEQESEDTVESDDGSDDETTSEDSDSESKKYNSEVIFETDEGIENWNSSGETLYLRNEHLYAIDVDGRERWSFNLGSGGSVPAIIDESVIVSTEDALYAINQNDGSTIWTYSADGGIHQRGPAAIEEDTAYIWENSHITAINLSNGSKRWKLLLQYIHSDPAVTDGTVFVGKTDGTFYAIDASSGEVVWSQNLPNSGEGSTTPPVAQDDTVYALSLTESYETVITALAMDDGTEQWSTMLNSRSRQRPVLGEGTLYIADHTNTLYAINTTDGSTLWEFNTDGRAFGSIVLLNETVYAGTNDGTMHAVNRREGTERWQFSPGPTSVIQPGSQDGVIYASLENKLYKFSVE